MQYQSLMKKTFANIPEIANATSNRIIGFAETLLGTKYRFGSSNPNVGFDCSGFVSYVFKHFGFSTNARSSVDFARKGKTVKLSEAKVGDVLVFTGTNRKIRKPGHVGIIYSIDENGIKFIHSSSGKAKSVIITSLDDGFYKNRLLKAVSVME